MAGDIQGTTILGNVAITPSGFSYIGTGAFSLTTTSGLTLGGGTSISSSGVSLGGNTSVTSSGLSFGSGGQVSITSQSLSLSTNNFSILTATAATSIPSGNMGLVFRSSGISLVYVSGVTVYVIGGSATSGLA